jgi:hypothetical protein
LVLEMIDQDSPLGTQSPVLLQAFAFNALSNRVGMLFQELPPFSTSSYDKIAYGVKFPEGQSRSRTGECMIYDRQQAASRADQDAVINPREMVAGGSAVRIFTVPNERQARQCATGRDGQLWAGRVLNV